MKTEMLDTLDSEIGTVVRGTVKWFNGVKGYGFATYGTRNDIFIHYSAIDSEGYKTLSEGQTIDFQLVETTKGLQAIDVKPGSLQEIVAS